MFWSGAMDSLFPSCSTGAIRGPQIKRNLRRAEMREEIDVTPEMLAAGELVLAGMDRRFESDQDVVEDIFRAMTHAATLQQREPSG